MAAAGYTDGTESAMPAITMVNNIGLKFHAPHMEAYRMYKSDKIVELFVFNTVTLEKSTPKVS